MFKSESHSGRALRNGAIGVILAAVSILSAIPAAAAEHSLAGIRIFADARSVLNRYGDPDEILTGASAQSGTAGASDSGLGGPNFPGARGPIGALPSLQLSAGGPGGPMMGGGGGYPGGFPGAMGGEEGGTDTNGTSTNTPPGEVLYVYHRPNNVTLDFLISPDGRVIQITVLGYKASVITERGVTLGTNYGKVVARYGYPEAQDNNGVALTVNYLTHSHVTFTLKSDKVVGITVAAVE